MEFGIRREDFQTAPDNNISNKELEKLEENAKGTCIVSFHTRHLLTILSP